ncbi:uncharacterized protein KGF55_000608 [Candida pseudojiufengensis]|uniref:uncharacterized protein n=1 Tax=Candida pseudojiufengensis TaxID=497109 RepID=UPI0022254E8D|nr:uncharacterized protein KGF55_000608 [Candida pseudojiufengensis]KAI5966299.1 hypothetical protein KGF55_000608 [Candida pseudojiufengensis]
MQSFTKSVFRLPIHQSLKSFNRMYASVGDKIPSTVVHENSPGNDVNLANETAKGKSILVGVPGAFSPGCSQSHIPGYIKNADAFKNKGYDQIFVLAVNDPFVTKAWGEELTSKNGKSSIRFLADSTGAFAKDLGVLFDATKVFGNDRSKRYALVVEDGKITESFVEPDNTSVDKSEASKVLESLK